MRLYTQSNTLAWYGVVTQITHPIAAALRKTHRAYCIWLHSRTRQREIIFSMTNNAHRPRPMYIGWTIHNFISTLTNCYLQKLSSSRTCLSKSSSMTSRASLLRKDGRSTHGRVSIHLLDTRLLLTRASSTDGFEPEKHRLQNGMGRIPRPSPHTQKPVCKVAIPKRASHPNTSKRPTSQRPQRPRLLQRLQQPRHPLCQRHLRNGQLAHHPGAREAVPHATAPPRRPHRDQVAHHHHR